MRECFPGAMLIWLIIAHLMHCRKRTAFKFAPEKTGCLREFSSFFLGLRVFPVSFGVWYLVAVTLPKIRKKYHQQKITFQIPSLKLTARPENRPLEKEIPDLETTILRGELLVSGRVMVCINITQSAVVAAYPQQK